ncbi:MAG: bacteriophage Gp15 family protein [Clostridiales bacterium]|nr:bacteriophage Gp15 family protein [Clostridiales bacterium]
MIDDFDLIVSSFRSSYGVSIYSEDFRSMTWAEFRSLLQGLGTDTPLARTAQIRLENDKDVLKSFTSVQLKIRSKWCFKRSTQQHTQDELNTFLAQMQAAFAAM